MVLKPITRGGIFLILFLNLIFFVSAVEFDNSNLPTVPDSDEDGVTSVTSGDAYINANPSVADVILSLTSEATKWFYNQTGLGGGGATTNIFDQWLNTTSNVTFNYLNVTNDIYAGRYVESSGMLGFSLQKSNNDLRMISDVGGANFFSIETAGAFFQLYANPNPSNDYLLATITETQGADTELNFYEGGTGHNRFWDSGSMRLGGGASYLCSNLTTEVDCDTAVTGADLVVQDDIWLGGTIRAWEDGNFSGTVYVNNQTDLSLWAYNQTTPALDGTGVFETASATANRNLTASSLGLGGTPTGSDEVLINATGTSAKIHFTDSTTGSTSSDGHYIQSGAGDFYVEVKETGVPFRIVTDGKERFRADSTGFVYIGGTFAPSQVAGDPPLVVQANTSLQGGKILRLKNSAGSLWYDFSVNQDGELVFANQSGTGSLIYTATGEVGIQNDAPESALHVAPMNAIMVGDSGVFNNRLNLNGREVIGTLQHYGTDDYVGLFAGGYYDGSYQKPDGAGYPVWIMRQGGNKDYGTDTWQLLTSDKDSATITVETPFAVSGMSDQPPPTSVFFSLFRPYTTNQTAYYLNTDQNLVAGANHTTWMENDAIQMVLSSLGYLGIGATTPDATLHITNINPELRLTDTSNNGIGKFRFTNQDLEIVNDADNAVANSEIQFEQDGALIATFQGTNLGIGEANPTEKLNVRGVGNFSGDVYINNGTSVAGLAAASTNYWLTANGITYNDTAGVLLGSTERISGQPYLLQAQDAAYASVYLNDTTNGNVIALQAANSDGVLRIDDKNVVASTRYRIFIDNAEQLTIDADGDLGLGINAPVDDLMISDTGIPGAIFRDEDAFAGDEEEHFRLQAQGKVNVAGTYNTNAYLEMGLEAGAENAKKGYMEFFTNNGGSNSLALRLTSDDWAGFNTATPSGNLVVYDSDTYVTIIANATGTNGEANIELQNDAQKWRLTNRGSASDSFIIRNQNAGSDFFTITTAGFLGLGTNSPSQNLDVRGAGNFSGTIYINNGTDVSTLGGAASTDTIPFGWAKLNDDGTASAAQTAFGDGSAEDTANYNISWGGNSFTVTQDGIYEARLNGLLVASSTTLTEYWIEFNGAIVNIQQPRVHSTVNPVGRSISAIGNLSAGQTVQAFHDSTGGNTITWQNGSDFTLKKIG